MRNGACMAVPNPGLDSPVLRLPIGRISPLASGRIHMHSPNSSPELSPIAVAYLSPAASSVKACGDGAPSDGLQA